MSSTNNKILPNNWTEAQFENIADATDFVANGSFQSLKENVVQTDKVEYAILIRLKDYSSGWNGTYKYVTKSSYEFLRKSSLVPGDLFVANVGYPGKLFIVPDLGQPMTIGPNGLRIRSNQVSSNKFLAYFYLSPQGKSIIDELVSGSAQQKFNKTGLRKSIVFLPPLNEQNRIVEKLDSLFTRIESIKERMETIPELIKQFRQSVLHAAVTGKLTEEWRNNKNLSPIDLVKLEDQRESLKKEYSQSRGRKSYKHKVAFKPDILGGTKGINELFQIPKKWEWVTIDQVIWNISDGPHFSPKYVDNNIGVRFISTRNVKYSGVDFSDCKYVSREDHISFTERGKPENGDVLLTKGGTTGIACVVEEDSDFSYWVHVALIKPITNGILSDYLRDALSSQFCYNQSQALTHGVGNQDLGLTRIIHIIIPLPPIEEQYAIAEKVEKLLGQAQRIEDKFNVLKESFDKLPDSILSKAFKGKLIPQDPNDEPAEKLLERILEEKARLDKKVKKLKSSNNQMAAELSPRSQKK